MDATQQRKMREGLVRSMRRRAGLAKCPACGRKGLGKRIPLPAEGVVIRRCRFCGHEKATFLF